MPDETQKPIMEELIEPLKVPEPTPIVIPPISKVRTSNLEDDINKFLSPYTAGDYVLLSSAVETGDDKTTYTKVKEATISRGGTLRISFEMKSESAGISVRVTVYRNGIAIGTEQSNSTITYVLKTEDISGWLKGDKVQIYVKSTSAGTTCFIQNFQIKVGNTDFEYLTLE